MEQVLTNKKGMEVMYVPFLPWYRGRSACSTLLPHLHAGCWNPEAPGDSRAKRGRGLGSLNHCEELPATLNTHVHENKHLW